MELSGMKIDRKAGRGLEKKIKVISITVFIALCMLLAKKVFASNITSVEDFQILMKGYGVLGPVILTFMQAYQVVVPVLPGYLGCAVGAISYGTVTGFLCNYVGISAGSIIAFFLAEKFGKKLVTEMFSEKQYKKWVRKIEGKKSYEAFLFVAILLPLFPDDFLCYLSGLVNMDRKRFVWIIVLAKPWCILVYSIMFGLI